MKHSDNVADVAKHMDKLEDAASAARRIDDLQDAATAAKRIDNLQDTAKTARKFSEYIFKDGAAPGKDVVFKNLGYTAEDSQMLANIYEGQAAAKYASGNYTLGKLDGFGQRINIEIELNGIGNAAGKTSYIQSGWMIQPDNLITLNTPFSGFTR
jgi:filamentous hemagglutinin